MAMKVYYGNACYDEHANATVSTLLGNLCKFFVGVNCVASVTATVQEAPLTLTIKKMMKNNSADEVQKQVSELVSAQESSVNEGVGPLIAALAHNVLNSHLAKVADAIGKPPLRIDGVANIACGDDLNAALPFTDACLLIRSYLKIRDVCLLAFSVAPLLDSDPATLSMQDVTVKLPKFVTALARNIDELDRSLADLNSTSIEDHWQLPLSIGVAMLWAKSISSFSGACQRKLLQIWSEKVEAATVATKSAIPSWSACFQDDGDNFEMATQLLRNKATSIVSAHNSLHSLLNIIGEAASFVGVSPRLQKHELTSQSIGVALFTLREAAVAAAVASGLDVINKFSFRADGPQEADKFLKHTPADTLAGLPNALVAQLKTLASDISAADGNGSASSQAAPPAPARRRMKRERAENAPPSKRQR